MCLRPNSHITLKNMYVLGKISRHEISPKKIKQISSGASGVSVIDMIQVQGLLPDRYEAQVSGWVPKTAIDILVRIRRLHHQWPFRWMWRILALQTSRSFATNFLKGKWGWKNSIPNSCAWHLRTWITLHFTSKHQRSCLHLFTKWPNRCDLKCLSWWIASPGIDLPFPSEQGSTHWNCTWARNRWFITSGKKQHLWPTQVLESTSCDLTIFAWVQFQVTTATEKVD